MDSYNMLESDYGYLEAVRSLAKYYGISLEEMLERERRSFANDSSFRIAVEASAADKQKIRDQCVYFCYQEVGEDVYKHTNGEMIHGWYRIVKTNDCYEFTIVDTNMQHESWQKAIKEKKVTRFPLEVVMGQGSFVNVTPEKIHTS